MKDRYFGSHEIAARDEVVKTSSNRSFGLVFAVFCAIVSALSFYNDGTHWHWWLIAAAVFGVLAFAAPAVLAPLNKVWFKFGLLLHVVMTPLILGMLFFVFVTPIGLLMRMTGKDPLRRRFEPTSKSYWIVRDPPGPAPETFKNQY